MMSAERSPRWWRRIAPALLAPLQMLALLALAPAPARAIDLADAPLFSATSVPGNLLLALSVEFPTASTPAYLNTAAPPATSATSIRASATATCTTRRRRPTATSPPTA
jgi:type IV pilus assembly protein PilY1